MAAALLLFLNLSCSRYVRYWLWMIRAARVIFLNEMYCLLKNAKRNQSLGNSDTKPILTQWSSNSLTVSKPWATIAGTNHSADIFSLVMWILWISRACHWLQVLPQLSLILSSPATVTGYMFSSVFHQSNISAIPISQRFWFVRYSFSTTVNGSVTWFYRFEYCL